MAKPCVLVTGFAPFGGETINPSWEAVSQLEGEAIGLQQSHIIHTKELPCEFDKALVALYQAIDKYHPSLVLCVGQAGGRAAISIERVAININDARIADNAGKQPIDTAVITGGPVAYWAALPIKRLVQALHQAQIPAEVSNSAGTYVCNHVMYGLLHYIDTQQLDCQGGFVHIPYLPEQAVKHSGAASMSASNVQQALKVILTEALANPIDIKLAAGTTH
ncbi:pyroglutamyl-peptidase I [Pseudoalteromonas fenneropenaei]|uniref:Pyrrolidone-carboxylate peptidase n=1 Tax=Pseudoalteromonas fenneropenaei TaxID=1737459 RepID=A0ABV7CHR0_9GAMM